MRRRVVITGMGAITPLGHSVGETFDAQYRRPDDVLADILARPHEDRSALAEQAQAEELAASTMTQVDRMADLLRDVNAGRLAAALDRLAADGRLSALPPRRAPRPRPQACPRSA